MSVAWGLGSVFGPAAGGLLVYPARTWPSLAGSVLDTHSFLLPCLIGAVLQAFCAIVCVCALREPGAPRARPRLRPCGWCRRRPGYRSVVDADGAVDEPVAVPASLLSDPGVRGATGMWVCSCVRSLVVIRARLCSQVRGNLSALYHS